MSVRCPFCNAVTIPAIHTRQARGVTVHALYGTYKGESVSTSYAVCLKCAACGPLAETEELALAKWNTR